MGINLGVVGATGQVGVAMRQILEEREFPVDQIRFFAGAARVLEGKAPPPRTRPGSTSPSSPPAPPPRARRRSASWTPA